MSTGADTARYRSGRLTPNPQAAKRRYLKAAVLLLLALGAGFVIGVSTTVIYFEKYHPQRKPQRTPREVAEGLVERMEKVVPLTEAEKTELVATATETMTRVTEIRDGFSDQMRDQFAAMNVKVAAIMGPDRYQKWDAAKQIHFAEQAKRDRRHWSHRRREREEAKKAQELPEKRAEPEKAEKAESAGEE